MARVASGLGEGSRGLENGPGRGGPPRRGLVPVFVSLGSFVTGVQSTSMFCWLEKGRVAG